MKKVLFLMFLLLLMGLGAAGVKAQVRIGGNAAPNASAVLDLNADDTNSGSKGLALPRVALTSNQMLLPGVTQNLTGMMVYNTSTTGTGVNRIGIYLWNGATWVQASLPSASTADSGKLLLYNGTSWLPSYIASGSWALEVTTPTTSQTPALTTWQLVHSSTIALPALTVGQYWHVSNVTGVLNGDLCVQTSSIKFHVAASGGQLYIYPNNGWIPEPATTIAVKCYRPSL